MRNIINLVKLQYYSVISLKNTFLIIFVLGSILSIQQPSFFLFPIVMLLMALTYNTATYEDRSKINYLIYSLPVKAKDYIISKYIFGLSNTLLASILCFAMYFICSKTKVVSFTEMQLNFFIISIFTIGVFFTAIVIPLGLILGFEKSRILMVFLAVLPVCFSTELVNFLPKLTFKITPTTLCILIFLIGLTFTLASYFVTSNMYCKKDIH